MVSQEIAGLDANIFISVINKETDYADSKKILDWIDDGTIIGVVSTIVIAELRSGYDASGDTQGKDQFLAHILGSSNYQIADVTVQVALDAGNLRASKGLKLPDALIIASTLRHRGEFLISNDLTMGKMKLALQTLSAKAFVDLIERKQLKK
ncbi:MAG TPA: PIN domain-containing protein [Nitrososphaerales archaeon]|nr:PIN domain-containing protein [Nitrososphaerales archaeon]